MPVYGIENPPRYGSELPLPSDINDNPDYQKACRECYDFWIRMLNRGIKGDELVLEGTKFFDEHFEDGVDEWLEGLDPVWIKRRAILIKGKAYQDWYRVHDGKRHNPPSKYFTQS